MPPRARPTTPSRKGAGGKGEEDDEFGDSRVKKAAASGDADALLGDMEAMTMTDYNRWLVTESNWSMAEECRQQHIEGEQFRKARDDRHRERGQLRQQDTVEQMKEAKTKVDAHRRTNLEQGSAVKRDVIAWHAAAIEDKMQYVQRGKEIREKVAADKAKCDEKAIFQAEKKAFGAAVKAEVDILRKEAQKVREGNIDSNKKLADKVRSETSDVVIDEAKKTFFLQRKQAAKDTSAMVDAWNTDRAKSRQAFMQEQANKANRVKSTKDGARNARAALVAQKQSSAASTREKRDGLKSQREQRAQDHASLLKQAINGALTERFVPADSARRMLQHPHYSEVSAVVADVTSGISREIASSPKRRRPISAGAANPAIAMAGQSPPARKAA